MTGEEIRFGIDNYKIGSRYMEKEVKGLAKSEYKNFAQQITFADIIKEMGGKDNLSDSDYDMYERMFQNIAGDDNRISAEELKGYLKKLSQAAGNDEMLNQDEMLLMAQKRGDFPSDETIGIFHIGHEDRDGKIPKFIKALIMANDKNLKAEEEQRDLESRTKYDQDGNKTITEKDGVTSTTYDKADHVIQRTYVDKSQFKHTDIYKDGKLVKSVEENDETKWITTYNQKGKPVEVKTVDKNSSYRTTKNITYDDKNEVAKEVEILSYEGKVFETTTTLYQNGRRVKEIVKSQEYNEIRERFYNAQDEYHPYQEIHKDEGGNIKYTEYYTYEEGNSNPIKIVSKNAKGETTSITLIKYDKDIMEPVREETQNGKGETTRIILTEYDKNTGYPVREETQNGNNETDTIVEFNPNTYREETKVTKFSNEVKTVTTFSKRRKTKLVVTDKQGRNTIKTEEYFYNAKDRIAKVVTKDGNGNILNTQSYVYSGKDRWSVEDRNGIGQVTQVHIYDGNKATWEVYSNGMLLCTEEHTRGENIFVYRNGRGEVITQQEFNELRQKSQLTEQ